MFSPILQVYVEILRIRCTRTLKKDTKTSTQNEVKKTSH